MLQKILEFLFSLHTVKITAGTRLNFAVEHPGWIWPAAIALAVVGYWSYRKQSTTPGKRMLLGAVRAATLVAVLLLFCRPQLVLDREEKTRSVVALWVDDSASMTLEDPYGRDEGMRGLLKEVSAGPGGEAAATRESAAGRTGRLNRYELAVAALGRAQAVRSLAESQDVAIFTGSSHARLVGVAHAPEQVATVIESLKKNVPTGESTDVPVVVQEILQSVQGQRVSAVVLLTDGQTTESGSRLDMAIQAAQRMSVKVFALPLGQAEEPFDLKIANMQAPENAFAKDPVAVKLHLMGTGILAPTAVKVTIYRVQNGVEQPLVDAAGRAVEREYTLEPGKKEMDVEIAFKPEKKGADKLETFELVAKVAAAQAGPEELTAKNNMVTGQVNVLDAKMTVLLVEGYPRWEYRYLKNELIREKTIDVSTLLLSSDENFAQEGDIPITRFPETAEELAKYDVLLIGDVEPTYFSPNQQRLIIDFVKKSGGGIGWIAGAAYSPEGYKGTPLEVLLPVVPDEIDPRARVMAPSDNAPFNLVLTAAGKDTNLFKFFDDPEVNARQMTELPELYWYKPIQGLKGSAEVLAVHPTRSIGGSPMPLIVTGRYGKGRTLYSGICDTWRWRRYTGEPLFQSYWLQMCRLLYLNKKLGQSRQVEMTAESAQVEVGKPIKVSMEIKDPTIAGQVPGQVSVQVIDAEGRPLESIALNRAPGSQDKLIGMTTATVVGELTLQVPPGVMPVDVRPYKVTVTPPGREFEKTTADVESLGMMASKTTGQVLGLWRTTELRKLIPDRSLLVAQSQPEELWPKPFALVLVVLLAATEWLLRKAAGLIRAADVTTKSRSTRRPTKIFR